MKPDFHIAYPLFHVAYIERTSQWSMPNFHYHDAYEIRILEEGSHQYILDGTLYNIKPYDCVMHKPGILHKSHNTADFKRIAIYFTDVFLNKYFGNSGKKVLLKSFEKPIVSLDKTSYDIIKKISLHLMDENINSPDNTIFIYLSYILNIICNSPVFVPKPDTANSQISAVLTYINQNYASIKTIDDIAREFYITKYYLAHKFKESTGTTIIQYMNSVRLRNACNLLINTKMSVTQIAQQCGYNSSIYFCNIFKKIYSSTPSQFRGLNK